MTERHDDQIRALFEAHQHEIADDGFTEQVMARIHRRQRTGSVIVLALSLVVAVAISLPLTGLVAQFTDLLFTALVDVSNETLAQLLLPINTVAGALGLSQVVIGYLYRKLYSR